jgi:hypothetical protein
MGGCSLFSQSTHKLRASLTSVHRFRTSFEYTYIKPGSTFSWNTYRSLSTFCFLDIYKSRSICILCSQTNHFRRQRQRFLVNSNHCLLFTMPTHLRKPSRSLLVQVPTRLTCVSTRPSSPRLWPAVCSGTNEQTNFSLFIQP